MLMPFRGAPFFAPPPPPFPPHATSTQWSGPDTWRAQREPEDLGMPAKVLAIMPPPSNSTPNPTFTPSSHGSHWPVHGDNDFTSRVSQPAPPAGHNGTPQPVNPQARPDRGSSRMDDRDSHREEGRHSYRSAGREPGDRHRTSSYHEDRSRRDSVRYQRGDRTYHDGGEGSHRSEVRFSSIRGGPGGRQGRF